MIPITFVRSANLGVGLEELAFRLADEKLSRRGVQIQRRPLSFLFIPNDQRSFGSFGSLIRAHWSFGQG